MMRQAIGWGGWPVVLLAALSLAHAAPDARIEVDCKAAVVERREFDPAKPPAEMPPLKGNEAAQCSSNFSCAARSNLSVTVKRDRSGKQVTAEATLSRVQVSAGLSITLWLPQQAPQKLVDHEEGHQRIIEKIYATAEAVAREEAARVLSQHVTATAATEAQAREAATKKADELLQTVNDRYLQRVAAYASTVGDTYDLLTAHGTKMKPDEAQAIEQAFAKHPAPTTSATAPATKPASDRP